MDKNAIIRLANDLNRGVKTFSFEDKTYSEAEAVDVLREALIDANGGSTKFDRKNLRRNKAEIFEIIEELVPAIVHNGLTGNEFWNRFVDYRNLALGDKNEFVNEIDDDYVVTTIADGIATPRRQRIGAYKSTSVDTSVHAIRIYDDFSRFMAGVIDWNTLCDKVAGAFQKKVWMDIWTAFCAATAYNAPDLYGDQTNTSGTVTEDEILDLIAKVEASTGRKAAIYGTQSALRYLNGLTNAISSDIAKDDLYNKGYIGKFLGTDVFKIDQVYDKNGTAMIDGDVLYIVGTDDKFIKFVDEGETLIDDRDWTQNADMTIEYRMIQRWGVEVVFNGKCIGVYDIIH